MYTVPVRGQTLRQQNGPGVQPGIRHINRLEFFLRPAHLHASSLNMPTHASIRYWNLWPAIHIGHVSGRHRLDQKLISVPANAHLVGSKRKVHRDFDGLIASVFEQLEHAHIIGAGRNHDVFPMSHMPKHTFASHLRVKQARFSDRARLLRERQILDHSK